MTDNDPASHAFPLEWQRGVYEAISRRRDMRSFRTGAIPRNVLARILSAAHQAGSVGYMQPWNFIVIENGEVRRKIREHVDEERVRAAERFEGERREQYLSLKLEGIIDSAVNVCVTCDRNRFGPVVLGRNTIPETDLYSTCCAIQNLWLAARAEGVGVGWVSILDPDILRGILGIPDHVVPVAYLCMGYVEHFPDRPLLETVGWLPRLSLEEVIYSEKWGEPSCGELLQAVQSVDMPGDVASTRSPASST